MIWLLCYFFYANGFVDLRVSKSSGIEHTSTSGREQGVWCVVSNRGKNGDNRSLDSCCHVCDHGYFVLSFPVPVEEEQCLKRGHILGLGWTEGLSCTVEQGLSSEKVNFSSFKMSLDFVIQLLVTCFPELNKWQCRPHRSLADFYLPFCYCQTSPNYPVLAAESCVSHAAELHLALFLKTEGNTPSLPGVLEGWGRSCFSWDLCRSLASHMVPWAIPLYLADLPGGRVPEGSAGLEHVNGA